MQSGMSKVRFVEVNGHHVAYRDEGSESAFPVVLIHAFAGQSASWSAISADLVKAGFRVIAVDLPGHGQSDWLARYALSSMEDELAAALDRLGLSQFDLMGHSLGGHLVLRLGARLPCRVRRMVVEAAPVPPRDEADAATIGRSRMKPSLWRSIRLLGIGRLIRIALFRQFDFKAARQILTELKSPMPQWWRSLEQIRSPCLVLTSSSDGAVSSRAGLVVASMRSAWLKRIGEGHHLHTNHREEFLDAVIPFLLAPACDGSRAGAGHADALS